MEIPTAIIFMILFVIGLNVLIIHFEKQSILKSAREKGWTIINISFDWFRGAGRSRSGTQYFNVEYKDENGTSHSTVCKIGLFTRLKWDV